jgi:hypothetical protein
MNILSPEGRAAARVQQPGRVRTADGVGLFYRDWGAGRPVLFLSGWTLNSQMWGYRMSPLSEAGFRCIAYDRRGHGRFLGSRIPFGGLARMSPARTRCRSPKDRRTHCGSRNIRLWELGRAPFPTCSWSITTTPAGPATAVVIELSSR